VPAEKFIWNDFGLKDLHKKKAILLEASVFKTLCLERGTKAIYGGKSNKDQGYLHLSSSMRHGLTFSADDTFANPLLPNLTSPSFLLASFYHFDVKMCPPPVSTKPSRGLPCDPWVCIKNSHHLAGKSASAGRQTRAAMKSLQNDRSQGDLIRCA